MTDQTITVGTAPKLRWGVLGCGVIANQMAQALQLQGRIIDAVANRTHDKAVAYAEKYGIPKVYDQIDDLFADPDIDAVYITTPHNTHITYLRKALAAGKHVMCEKAITLNSDELDEAIALARENNVVLMDACTELHMPLYKELVKRAKAGDFGTINLIQENFGSFKEYDERNRFFNPNLAGGAMLDIGIYSLTLMRLFMESTPNEHLSMMNPAPTGVDMTSGLCSATPRARWASSRSRSTPSSPSARSSPPTRPTSRSSSTRAPTRPPSCGPSPARSRPSAPASARSRSATCSPTSRRPSRATRRPSRRWTSPSTSCA